MAPLVAAWYAGVKETLTLKVFIMSLYKFATNELPLSEIAVLGAPYLANHWRKALLTSEAEAVAMGKASIHLEVRQKMVNRNLMPSDSGSGPTTSRCMAEKRWSGT